MSDKNLKDIRKQIRNVVQELLPALLQTEVFQSLYSNLQAQNRIQLEGIEKNIKDTLKDMNDRSKDVQSFIMREIQAELSKSAQNIPSVPSIDSLNVE